MNSALNHFFVVFFFVSFHFIFVAGFKCSDGGGRSGVYLAIDANMELAEEEDCFHVFGYLKKLRQSRKGLIENVVSGWLCLFFCLFSLFLMKMLCAFDVGGRRASPKRMRTLI